MKFFTNYLISTFIPNKKEIGSTEFRSRISSLEGWTSIVVNLFLFVLKLFLGLISSSISLIGDAFHTLSDTSTSIVILFSSKIAKKPSDMEHPFGHQRAEAISTIVIATLLFITGIEIGKSAIERIFHPSSFRSNWWIMGIIFLTIIIKELLAQFAKHLGAIAHSTALKADSWHHRSDAITTLLVLITFILGKFNIFYFDGYVGVALALFIMYSGYAVSKEAVNHLLGSAPNKEFIQRVKQLAQEIPNVSNVHDIILHQYGENKILSMHIEVPTNLSLLNAHQIAEEVELKIENELKTHTTVHYEPKQLYDKNTDSIRKIIEIEIDRDEHLESYHALYTKGSQYQRNVFFDLVVRKGTTEVEIETIRQNLITALKDSSKHINDVFIKIEALYPFQSQID